MGMEHFLNMKEELEEEEKFYNEEPTEKHFENIRKAGESLIEHACDHMSGLKPTRLASDGEPVDTYAQLYLNLSMGLELFLKSEFIKRKINIVYRKKKNKLYTMSFREIIENLGKILDVDEEDLDEIKVTLNLIRIRRDNLAHLSHKRLGHYANEHRIFYVTLLIYDKLDGNKEELIKKLKERIEKSKVQSGMDYKPLKYVPRQLINNGDVSKWQ